MCPKMGFPGRIGPSIRALLRDERGAALTEFGLIAPVFFFMMLGLFDLGQMAYTKAVMDGAVQEAARSVSLETGNLTQADFDMKVAIQRIAPDAVITVSRQSYFDFADLGRPELFEDNDGNGVCNNGENYTDENANGSWDADVGVSGNGAASDVVIFNVKVTYERFFPIPFFPGDTDTRSMESTVVKKNQPFTAQAVYSSGIGSCT